jgi:hypothetical protein
MSGAPESSRTVKVREKAVEALPPEKLLPDGQPTYVASWIYVFGVASIAALVVIITSGTILALKGPARRHYKTAAAQDGHGQRHDRDGERPGERRRPGPDDDDQPA